MIDLSKIETEIGKWYDIEKYIKYFQIKKQIIFTETYVRT